ncbi:MAG: FecR domain-containing protein [Gemmatimonadetes bacterium]|nr:FecR domain-containing protein [Gemmatimonadota bacterium]
MVDDQLLYRSLKGQTSDEEERIVRRWRMAGPGNEERYQELSRVLAAASRGFSWPASTPPATLEILEEAARRRAARSQRRWPGWAPIALVSVAAAATLLLAVGVWRMAQRAETLAITELVTGPEETTTIGLTDGTVVRLGGSSQLRFDPQSDQRTVHLKGRAYFAVAKQPGRPFRVKTEGGELVVLGTRFDVDAQAADLRMVVVEGRVAVAAARGGQTRVSAGQVSRVVDGRLLPTQRVPDASGETKWVGRFLAFQNTPLRQVGRDIERVYGVRVVVDTTIADRTITTWLADRSLAEVLRIVCAVSVATCANQDGVVTISGS